MSDRLFDLCEKQLLSILEEAGTSIFKVTESTSLAVRESSELFQMIEQAEHRRPKETDLCSSMEARINEVIINMQFFDELSQRIEHILEIVDLIKVESNREGFLSDPRDSEELFNNIKSIFSIRSEFEVMRDIFPEYSEVEESKMIELF
jgi:hypothetical protein